MTAANDINGAGRHSVQQGHVSCPYCKASVPLHGYRKLEVPRVAWFIMPTVVSLLALCVASRRPGAVPVKEIRAQSFILQNADGTVGATLAFAPDGRPSLKLMHSFAGEPVEEGGYNFTPIKNTLVELRITPADTNGKRSRPADTAGLFLRSVGWGESSTLTAEAGALAARVTPTHTVFK